MDRYAILRGKQPPPELPKPPDPFLNFKKRSNVDEEVAFFIVAYRRMVGLGGGPKAKKAFYEKICKLYNEDQISTKALNMICEIYNIDGEEPVREASNRTRTSIPRGSSGCGSSIRSSC
jgi:hypothetical protein